MTRGAPDLVVGAGVMGASLARALARSGRDVVLLGAGPPGERGASAVPTALLNPHRGRRGHAHPDDLAALTVTWRWAAELRAEGLDPGAERTGVLRLADGAAQARSFARVAGLRTLEPGEVPAPYRATHGGALAAEGDIVAPRRWLGALAASAAAAGAALVTDALVVALERAPDGGWRAVAADGRQWTGRRLLIATGADAWPPAWERTVGPTPGFARHAGDVVATALPAPSVPLAGSRYVGRVEGPAGPRAAVGGHHRPPRPPSPRDLAELTAGLAWAWPALADAPARDAWWGVRAHAAANRPQVQSLASDAWWVGALAGRGFLVAAAVADGVAELLRRPE